MTIKDLEVVHVKGSPPFVYWHNRPYETWRGIMRMEAYTLGELPPRYPVPAIKYELLVELEPKFLGRGAVLFVEHKRDGWLELCLDGVIYCTDMDT